MTLYVSNYQLGYEEAEKREIERSIIRFKIDSRHLVAGRPCHYQIRVNSQTTTYVA